MPWVRLVRAERRGESGDRRSESSTPSGVAFVWRCSLSRKGSTRLNGRLTDSDRSNRSLGIRYSWIADLILTLSWAALRTAIARPTKSHLICDKRFRIQSAREISRLSVRVKYTEIYITDWEMKRDYQSSELKNKIRKRSAEFGVNASKKLIEIWPQNTMFRVMSNIWQKPQTFRSSYL